MKSYALPKLIVFLGTLVVLATSCTKTVTDNPPPNQGDNNDGGDTPEKTNIIVTTAAGKLNDKGNAEDGNGIEARFWNPTKMVYDSRNNLLYIADGTVIRSMDAQNNVNTYMPLGVISGWNEILDMALAPGVGGSLYIVTAENDLLKIEPDGASVKKTVLIDRIYGGNETGPLNSADELDGTNGVATGKNGEIYFFNTFWDNLRRVKLSSLDPVEGTVEPFAGRPTETRSGEAWPFADGLGDRATFGGRVADITSDAQGTIYVGDLSNNELRMITPTGNVTSLLKYVYPNYGEDIDGPIGTARGNGVAQLACTPNGSSIFFSTYGEGGWGYSPALRVVQDKKNVITLVHSHKADVSDGTGETAVLGTIGGLACTPDGKTIYVAEPYSKIIQKVTIQ